MNLAVCRSESLGKKGWLKAANFVVTVAICLSTMFLKQHSVIDVLFALAMAVTVDLTAEHLAARRAAQAASGSRHILN